MTDTTRPDVSLAIACYNAMPYLDAAIESALAQQDVSVEVLIVDDGSSDGSLACAKQWVAHDSRVRLFRTPHNMGPGGARNVALSNMRGSWYAVLDSDDLITPERSHKLIAAAQEGGADLIADDLRIFGEGIEESGFLKPGIPASGVEVTLEGYFHSSAIFGDEPNFGFLKPMIRKSTLDQHGIRYNEALRIAEDDELIVQLLLAGAAYRVIPMQSYRYRKHGASISHRLSLANVERMLASETDLRRRLQQAGSLTPSYRRRWRALLNAVAFTRAIDALQRRKPLAAARAVLAHPGSIRLFAMPIRARLKRLIGGG